MKERKIKLKVDFYADGFRSGVIEVPKNIELLRDKKKRIYIAEKLVEHLPKDRKWRFPGKTWPYSTITIIRARRRNDKN